jgi:hypothetical protein
MRRRERLRRADAFGIRTYRRKRPARVRAAQNARLPPKELGRDAHFVRRCRSRVENTLAVRHRRHHERSPRFDRRAPRSNQAERAIFDRPDSAKRRVDEKHAARANAERAQSGGNLIDAKVGHRRVL